MRARLLLAALAASLLACAEAPPGLPPPGLDGKAPRLFYPLGLALSKDGKFLYVVNSNFDRSFSGGTLVRLPTSLFVPGMARVTALSKSDLVGRVDALAGELRLNPTGDALYLTSRDHNLLTRIPLNAQDAFSCGPGKSPDCSSGAIDLGAEDMPDPFAITFADLVPPGQSSAEPFVIVSHLSTVSTGPDTSAKDAFVALIPEAVARSQAQQPFSHGAYRVDLGTTGTDSLLFDGATRRLFVGGCFERVDPQTVISCQQDQNSTYTRTNPLRVLVPEAGASTLVTRLALGSLTGGGDTVAIASSSDGTKLYVATALPSALETISLPAPGDASLPKLVATVPLANQPSQMLVLRRPTGDLLVVSATTHNAVLVVDPIRGQVLSQLDPDSPNGGLGQGPYGLQSAPTATGDRVYVSLFNDCAVEALDVPGDDPSATSVVGIVGKCP